MLGRARLIFLRWIELGQYGFPFAIGRYESPVGRFRALARRARYAWRGRLVHALLAIAMTLSWPFGAISATLRTARDARNAGRAYTRGQWFDMLWLALRHSIPPLEYALYRLDEPARREALHDYVYWNDLAGLWAVNERRGADNRDVQDKDRFAEICARHGFPHVATLAVFDGGRQVFPDSRFVPEAPVIWKKALRLKGGAGGSRWARHDAVYRDENGETVPAGRMAERFRNEDCLFQPFVENHPAIASISNGTLAALRIVTGMNRKHEAEYVTGLISLPHGPATTLLGAIMCGVDADTGRIRKAILRNGESIDTHPDTEAAIPGVALPFWAESVALVLRAHASAFPRFAFLGWDVALTPTGPLLLETNSGWGALFHQMLDGPLGNTSFSRLVGQYV